MMTDKERITHLEERIAQLEARLAVSEQRFVPLNPAPVYPVYPWQPLQQPPWQSPYYFSTSDCTPPMIGLPTNSTSSESAL